MKRIFSKQELSEIFNQDVQCDISGICVNSKEAKYNDIFIALKGENADAHDFVHDALNKGASLAIVERKITGVSDQNLILVDSSYDALLKLANHNLKQTIAKYICVTGSVGKTTTKDMMHHILSQQDQFRDSSYVSMKNFNSQIGLPICVAAMPKNTKIGVFEMGMSSKNDIRKLVEIIRPSVALITNVCETHLEFFDSVFDIAKAKSEIFEQGADFAIIPSDSPYFDFLKNKALSCGIKNIFSFGSHEKSDAKIILCDSSENSINIRAKILGKTIDYQLLCNNESFAFNSIAAILATHIVSGIDVENLALSLSSFTVSSKRGEIIKINDPNIIIIDDSYNASPVSMKSAIHSLAKYENRRKILIAGDMKELGPDAIYFHENLSPTIDKYDINLVFACGNLMKYLYDNLLEQKKGDWKETSSELIRSVLEEIKDGDCILVKGSRSMKTELIVDAIKTKFLD